MNNQNNQQVTTVIETKGLTPTPLLITAAQAAATCSKSRRTWWAWDAAGLIPKPVRIGRSVFWRVDEIREWIVAGCPRREDWETSQS